MDSHNGFVQLISINCLICHFGIYFKWKDNCFRRRLCFIAVCVYMYIFAMPIAYSFIISIILIIRVAICSRVNEID